MERLADRASRDADAEQHQVCIEYASILSISIIMARA